MFKHYSIMALKNFLRTKLFSFINIFGLATGIACFLLMFLYLQFYKSYDTFHKNSDQIHLVYGEKISNGNKENRANIGTALAPLIREQVSGISNITRFHFSEGVVFHQGKRISENMLFTDPDFFDMFSFPLIIGDSKTALNEPFTIVITPKMADKYFGDSDPVGQIVNLKLKGTQKRYDFKITGVLNSIPPNSHMKFDWLASYGSLYQIMHARFLYHHWDSATLTYIQLYDNVNPADIENQFHSIAATHIDKEEYDQVNLKLLPFNQLYFREIRIDGYLFGSGRYIKMFITVMAFLASAILLLACLNYINLSTAKSITRSKEVGLRKVIGSTKKQIRIQFLGEAILTSFFALVLSVVLVEVFLPFFNSTIGLSLSANYMNNFSYLAFMPCLCILIGLAAGSYPAFIISAFQPAFILQSKTGIKSPAKLRQVFVVLQFLITTIFFISFLRIEQLTHYIQSKELGFDKEHIIVLPIKDGTIKQKYQLIKHELLQSPHILNVAGSSQKPGTWSSPNWISISSKSIKELGMCIVYTDYDYVKTLGLKLNEGRAFMKEISSDRHSVLMNESAYQLVHNDLHVGEPIELGWKSHGQFQKRWDTNFIGVLKDFHFRNLGMIIQPVIFKCEPDWINYLLVRIQSREIDQAIRHIDRTLQALTPDQPMDYSFLDEDIQADYQQILTLKKVIGTVMGLAICIACLGLFGLSSFIIERRTKEIGIRKVLGASFISIFIRLCAYFVKRIALANIIAWPIAYGILKNNIFQQLHYQPTINGWIFVIASIAGFIIALLTVSWQAIRAATANPVDALRYE